MRDHPGSGHRYDIPSRHVEWPLGPLEIVAVGQGAVWTHRVDRGVPTFDTFVDVTPLGVIDTGKGAFGADCDGEGVKSSHPVSILWSISR